MEEPLGWYFAGKFSFPRKAFDFFKKSAEGGCSWGQVQYGWCFKFGGDFVEKDKRAYVEWLEKAANRNNPLAMDWLGEWFRAEANDQEKAVSYYRTGAELGWKNSMGWLANMLMEGEGCAKDLRQAVIWGAKGNDSYVFWHLLRDARRALESGATEKLDCDFNQLCYTFGWGLYWYQYGTKHWGWTKDDLKPFGNRCLDFYCSCVELQQKSVLTFLLCCKQTTGGMKDLGAMIGKMVWEGRADALLLKFEGKQKGRGCVLF
jgi:TPR repeat protein